MIPEGVFTGPYSPDPHHTFFVCVMGFLEIEFCWLVFLVLQVVHECPSEKRKLPILG